MGWTLGPLREVVASGGPVQGGQLAVRLSLVGWNGQALGVQHRIRTAEGTLRLEGLGPQAIQLEGHLIGGEALSLPLPTTPLAIGFHGLGRPLQVSVLLDNSLAAASADPGSARIAGSRAVLQMLACQEGCPLGPARVGLIALAGGAISSQHQPSWEASLLDPALERLVGNPAGEAPLWDGLLAAVDQATSVQSITGPFQPVVLCYTANGQPGPSRATREQVEQQLARTGVRLWVVQHQGISTDLLRLSLGSQGGWIGVSQPGLESALRSAAVALGGSWQASFGVGALAEEMYQLRGRLRLSLGGEQRSVELDWPVRP